MKIASQIKQGHNYEDMFVRALSRVINLYSDRSHFIHELMQNAEDVKASQMRFELYDDRLEVLHDGKPFTADNLRGICDVGLSDKIGNDEQIGQFGIGFKAVFGICDVVRLYSTASNWHGESFDHLGDFSLEIQNFVNPVDIDFVKLESPYTTCFVFPFAVGKEYHSFESCPDLAAFLDDRLNTFDSSSLLFMKNLTSLTYVSHLNGKESEHVYELVHKSVLGQFEELYTGDINDDVHYLKFSRRIPGDSRNVDIAFCFRYDNEGNRVFIAPPTPYLFIYFPTVTYSHLNFIVQGPYHTTPNRSTLPEDDPVNDMLVDETVELFYRSVLILKDLGYLNLQLLSLLPITPPPELFDSDKCRYRKKWLFAPVHNKMLDMLETEALIPCHRKGFFASIDKAVIFRNQKLFTILDDDILSELMNAENMHIASAELLKDDNSAVYSALRKMKVRVVEVNSLPKLIDENPGFLKERDKEWLEKFYNVLADYSALFRNSNVVGNFCNTKIILTSKGIFACPRKNAVYKPSAVQDERYLFVDDELYERCPEFFGMLNLGNPNIVDSYLTELKLKYNGSDRSSISLAENAADWKRLIDLVDKYNLSQSQNDRVSLLNFLAVRKPGSQSFLYMSALAIATHENDGVASPQEGYYLFPAITDESIDANRFFDGIFHIGIIDFDFYLQHGVDLRAFNDKHTIYDIKYSIAKKCCNDWHRNDMFSGNTKVCAIAPFKMDLNVWFSRRVISSIGDNASAASSRYKSTVIMNFLRQNADSIHGRYHERVSNPTTREDDCVLLKLLKDRSWVYTEDNRLVCTADIYPTEASRSLYGNIDDPEFFRVLGFKESEETIVDSFIDEFLANGGEKRQSIFVDTILKRHFGLTAEQVKRKLDIADSFETSTSSVFNIEESDFSEFPTRRVKNYDRLKAYDLKYFENAPDVRYEPKMINQRVSLRSADNKTYVGDMYQYGNTGFYACQMCQKPTKYITAVEIINNPVKELAPMHLCLCPECGRKFLHYRNKGKGRNLENFIDELKIAETGSENVDIAINNENSITFTAMHLAEIQEMVKLLGCYEPCIETEETGVGVEFNVSSIEAEEQVNQSVLQNQIEAGEFEESCSVIEDSYDSDKEEFIDTGESTDVSNHEETAEARDADIQELVRMMMSQDDAGNTDDSARYELPEERDIEVKYAKQDLKGESKHEACNSGEDSDKTVCESIDEREAELMDLVKKMMDTGDNDSSENIAVTSMNVSPLEAADAYRSGIEKFAEKVDLLVGDLAVYRLYEDSDRKHIKKAYSQLKTVLSRVPTREELFEYGIEHGECYCLEDYISLLEECRDFNGNMLVRMQRSFIEYIEALDIATGDNLPVLMAFCKKDQIKPYITEEELFESCQRFYAHTGCRNNLTLPNGVAYEDATSKVYRQWAIRKPFRNLAGARNSWFTRNGEGLLSFRPFIYPYLSNSVFAEHVYDVLMYRYKLYWVSSLI